MSHGFRNGSAWDFDDVLGTGDAARAIRRAVERAGGDVPDEVVHALRAGTDAANNFPWSQYDHIADVVASELEALCQEQTAHYEATVYKNAAISIRVRARGQAARSKPLAWSRLGPSSWEATDPRGTHWRVDAGGAITIAHWDWADWRCATTEAARLAVEELVVAPGLPEAAVEKDCLTDVARTPEEERMMKKAADGDDWLKGPPW